MRIIKEGKKKEKEIKRTCHACLTRFAYERSDIEHDRDGGYVRCPKCKSFIATS